MWVSDVCDLISVCLTVVWVMCLLWIWIRPDWIHRIMTVYSLCWIHRWHKYNVWILCDWMLFHIYILEYSTTTLVLIVVIWLLIGWTMIVLIVHLNPETRVYEPLPRPCGWTRCAWIWYWFVDVCLNDAPRLWAWILSRSFKFTPWIRFVARTGRLLWDAKSAMMPRRKADN